jgi:hypothetical protein
MFEGEKHRMERESEYFWHYLIVGFNVSLEAVNHANIPNKAVHKNKHRHASKSFDLTTSFRS